MDFWPSTGSVLYYIGQYESMPATPLNYAALCGFHVIAEQLIIKHPQQVNTTGGSFVSPLGAALSGGHLKIAQLLYERGANVDIRGRNGRTPLISATWVRDLEIVRWLLSRSADPNAQDKEFGWTPQHLAANDGHVEISR